MFCPLDIPLHDAQVGGAAVAGVMLGELVSSLAGLLVLGWWSALLADWTVIVVLDLLRVLLLLGGEGAVPSSKT